MSRGVADDQIGNDDLLGNEIAPLPPLPSLSKPKTIKNVETGEIREELPEPLPNIVNGALVNALRDNTAAIRELRDYTRDLAQVIRTMSRPTVTVNSAAFSPSRSKPKREPAAKKPAPKSKKRRR